MSGSIRIPILDLKPQVEALAGPLNEAFQRVLASTEFILGPEERQFEREMADYLGVEHAIGLNSGTDALFIALRALGIGPGDEVLTTPFTFFATSEAISHVGATPVFVDIEPDSFNIDCKQLEAKRTSATRAIIPVHLFGRPANMDAVLAFATKHNLHVVEDCAQSIGARVGDRSTGSLGAFGAFSFFPTKNLGAYGDGGMVVTNDADLADTARMLRAHGSRKRYYNETIGYNSRLDEVQAAILRVKLPHLNDWNGKRREAARRYSNLLKGVPGVVVPELVDGHVFHQYTIRVTGALSRDQVVQGMADRGIGTMVYYPVPCHRLKIYQDQGIEAVCPIAEQATQEVMSLPIYPEITEAIQREVVEGLAQVLEVAKVRA